MKKEYMSVGIIIQRAEISERDVYYVLTSWFLEWVFDPSDSPHAVAPV
jgi:hypothetical protein